LTVYAALLRGVNVGGNHLIRMAELRELCSGLGLEDVQTLLQSGNVVFRDAGRHRDPRAIASALSNAIEGRLGFRPETVVRTAAEMRTVVDRNPFRDRVTNLDGAKLTVTFLGTVVPDSVLAGVVAPGSEELHHCGTEVFAYFPDGMGRSKLPALLERSLRGVVTTTRNWNTVLKLLDMMPQP